MLTPAVAGLVPISFPSRVLWAVVLVCVGQGIAIAEWLPFANPLAVLWVVVYVFYIARFQIIPEERVLAALFGAEYEAYKSRVRRWI